LNAAEDDLSRVRHIHVCCSAREINASLARPEIKAKYDDLGLRIRAGSPADFGKLISDETERWAKVIRAANIKPE